MRENICYRIGFNPRRARSRVARTFKAPRFLIRLQCLIRDLLRCHARRVELERED